MRRKDFLRSGILGISALGFGKVAKAKVTASSEIEQVGFEHIPPNEKKTNMKKVLHRAATRGHANHGWLDTHHTFSFANYRNPERMHFGALRVLNDDRVAAGRGFGMHPHDNMEIVSIPLKGNLEHRDNMGNTTIIKEGDVQIMSAGTGVFHSEMNQRTDQDVEFLQIWIFPKRRNITPRYDQQTFHTHDRKNTLQTVVSPENVEKGIDINQDAYLTLAELDSKKYVDYTIRKTGNGVYIFVLEGSVEIAGETLERRDGLGVWDTDGVKIAAVSDAEVLLLEVPMEI